MRSRILTRRVISIGLSVALVLTTSIALNHNSAVVSAQSGGAYDLTWNTMDDGGGISAGGAYSLSGTIGQFDAGTMSGGAYTLIGGFWVDFQASRLMLPLILK
jgi:hypothetical protein